MSCECFFPGRCGGSGVLHCRPFDFCFCECGCQEECPGCGDCEGRDLFGDDDLANSDEEHVP